MSSFTSYQFDNLKYKKKTSETIGLFLCMFVLIIMTFFDIRGSLRTIVSMIILLIYIGFQCNKKIFFLFFLLPFSADISVFFLSIPYKTIIEIIFLTHAIFLRKYIRIRKEFVICLTIILMFQLVAIINFNQTPINIIIFIVNILLMYVLGEITYKSGRSFFKSSLIYFALGTIFSLVAGLYRDTSESWERFEGLWTDPNFLGMFCIIAILSLIIISEMRLKLLIFLSPLLSLIMYCGHKTSSRTFAIALVFSFIHIGIVLNKKKKLNLLFRCVATGVGLCLFIFIVNKYFLSIVNSRGLISKTGEDWSNGRIADTLRLFGEWKKYFTAISFGVGINNSFEFLYSHSIRAKASHNTFVDSIIEFGILGFGPLSVLLMSWFKKFRLSLKGIWSLEGSLIMIIPLYSLTLSLLKYDFFYMFLGLMPYILSKKGRLENEKSYNVLFTTKRK